MLIDTHCHLDAAEFDADRDAVVGRALTCGIETMIVPAVERANFGAVASVCRAYAKHCVPAYGIHPLYVKRAREDDFDALRAMLNSDSAVAVGEIGLDFFLPERDEARQTQFFSEQLKIAADFDLPVVLHVRRAVDAVLKELRRNPVRGGIAHAFNGSRQQADEFIEMGFKLGFGGAMTYDGSHGIRRLAASLPMEAIVLETDAPDIPPQWLSRSRNEPAELRRISTVLAELRSSSTAEIESWSEANATKALPGLAAATDGGKTFRS